MKQERRRRATLPSVSTPRGLTLRSTSADEESGALPVRTANELGPLVSEITSDTRSWAVVGLTSRHGQDRPALSPAAVRAIVGPTVPIYLICWRVTISLQKRLPNDLHVFGGAARIWWPMPKPDRRPASHPLVYDGSGEYGAAALTDLECAYHASRPPSRQSEQQLRRERDNAEGRARGLASQVSELTQDRDQVAPEITTHRRTEADTRADDDFETILIDTERKLHLMICEQWYDASSGRTSREQYPLGRYIIASRLIADLHEHEVGVPLHRLGWVMAMVASGRAPAILGLSVHPLVTGTGRASQLIRARDGAKGWRCTLAHISGGPRLHYWILPNGVIEFEAVGYHDKLSSSIR